MSIETFAKKNISEIEYYVNAIRKYTHTVNRQLERDYPEDAQITIQVPVRKIKESFNKYKFVHCNGFIGPEKVHWIIASKNLSNLCSKLEPHGEINLLDYLPLLIPSGNRVGLVTFQNGIRNELDDFLRMGELISKNFPENPLFIGLYNPTEGIVRDMDRIAGHTSGAVCGTVCRTRLMLSKLGALLKATSPFLKWLHIAHSEGGAIAHLALKSILTSGIQSLNLRKGLFENRLITASYGPVFPIPTAFALKTYNIYSDRDFATKLWAEYFCRDKDYEIEFVESMMKIPASPLLGVSSYVANWPVGIPPGDHDFQGATYQSALRKTIEGIRDGYGIASKMW